MTRITVVEAVVCVALSFLAIGCERKVAAEEKAPDTGPAPAKVEPDMDASHFKVDHPEQFPLVTATERIAAPELNVTGVVSPDVSRQVPVPSLATGRIVEIDARLGDEVQKGQLLFKVNSTDVSGAYSEYRKAVKNEQLAVENNRLAKIQLDRAKLLFDDGAIPKSAYEVAQNGYVGTQIAVENAKIDTETSREHLKLLGSDPDHPSAIISVYAPVSGVITDQQITNSSGVQALGAANPFTISDISHVWVICDVYENNIAQVHMGEYADIHLVAYPNRVLRAKINNILPMVDPATRTEKVRLEVENPGLLRLGMFVTATFHGESSQKHAVIPASAILHLHDREWVYEPAGDGYFKRMEVTAGGMLADNMQEVTSGLNPGDQVVAKALVLQSTVEQ